LRARNEIVGGHKAINYNSLINIQTSIIKKITAIIYFTFFSGSFMEMHDPICPPIRTIAPIPRLSRQSTYPVNRCPVKPSRPVSPTIREKVATATFTGTENLRIMSGTFSSPPATPIALDR
jgi:hypothetical protein